MYKDYIAQVKIKNGPLLLAMRLAGYKTAADPYSMNEAVAF